MTWTKSLFHSSIADWNQEDSDQLNYIKNKPKIATAEDAIDFLSQNGYMLPMATSDGTIFTNDNGEIYTLS